MQRFILFTATYLKKRKNRPSLLPWDGERKIVLATPIAETSITIEGVKFVIDTGYCRRLNYDAKTGLSHLDTVRISKDMAVQRAGRAGRLTEGICYRLGQWQRNIRWRNNVNRKFGS